MHAPPPESYRGNSGIRNRESGIRWPLGVQTRSRPRDVLPHDRLVRGRPFDARFIERMNGLGVAAVTDGDGDIAAKPAELGACHRASLDERAEIAIRSTPQIDQARRVESRTRLPGIVARMGRGLVVGTHLLTDVAA